MEVDPERFEQLVADALDGIPPELGRYMENVAVVVVDRSRQAGLLGLYEGLPLTQRGIDYSGRMPDRISIFRQAICAICTTEDEVIEQVRITVVHEVGHHFGIDDRRLTELGYG